MTADLKRVSPRPQSPESTVQSVAAARIHRPWRTEQNGKTTAEVPTMRRTAGDKEEMR